MGIENGWDAWDVLHLVLDERLSGPTRWFKNFVMKGFGLADGGGLQVLAGEPGLNVAYVNGYELAQQNAATLPLVPSATNHVFLLFTKTPDFVAGTASIAISYAVNTTGVAPNDSIKLGEADTDPAFVTAIRQQENGFKIHDAQLETDVEGNQKQIKNQVHHEGTAFPTNPPPVIGQPFYRTDLPALFVFNGVGWEKVLALVTGGTVVVDGNIRLDGDLVPGADGAGNIGTDALRFGRVRAAAVVSGDLGFDDKKCPKCGRGFSEGEELTVKVTRKEGEVFYAVPCHRTCETEE